MNGVKKKYLQKLSGEADDCHTSDGLKGAGEGPEGMSGNSI